VLLVDVLVLLVISSIVLLDWATDHILPCWCDPLQCPKPVHARMRLLPLEGSLSTV
jgi:hypothetical protein